MVKSLLIVEPHRETRFNLITTFGNSNYQYHYKIWSADCADHALQILEKQKIDVIVTELCLRDMSGFLFLDQICALSHVVVYSHGNEEIILRAFEKGIDDFALKAQATIQELILRIEAVLRRTEKKIIQVGHLCIDVLQMCIWDKETKIELSHQCVKFLLELMLHPNQIRTHDELAYAVCDMVDTRDYSRLYVLALALRKKLEPDPKNPKYIRNVRGIGYLLNIST